MKKKMRVNTYYKPNNTNMGLLYVPKKKAIFNTSTMLRMRDKIKLNGKVETIGYFVHNQPIALWHRINNKQENEKSIYLIPKAYAKLREVIKKVEPHLIEDVINKKRRQKDLSQLKQKINDGLNPTKFGRFKKIGSRKVVS